MPGTGLRAAFCVSGNGWLFRSAVLHAEDTGVLPALAVLDHTAAPALQEFCATHGVPVQRLAPRAPLVPDLLDWCGEAQAELLVLTFDRIVPPPVVERFRGRAINVHPGLLPAFAGLDALGQTVAAGARFAGATIHEVAEEVDAGAIVAQCVLGTRPDDTAASIGARLFGPLRLMFLQVLRWYAEGRVETDPAGLVVVRDARYGELPVSPAVEHGFPQRR